MKWQKQHHDGYLGLMIVSNSRNVAQTFESVRAFLTYRLSHSRII